MSDHLPIGILSTDVGPFIRCSCGTNPSPHHWLAAHWPGDEAEGTRLAEGMFAREKAKAAAGDVVDSDTTEQKHLIETATRLGYELGRKETIDEFAAACAHRARLANRMPEPDRTGVREGMIVAWIAAEKLALGMASQPNGAAPEGLIGAPASTGTPEDSQAGRIRIPVPGLTKGGQ